VDAGYTNDSNPFGDTNLTERFVWHKKLEKQITDGVDLKELGVKAEKSRQEQRLVRLAPVDDPFRAALATSLFSLQT